MGRSTFQYDAARASRKGNTGLTPAELRTFRRPDSRSAYSLEPDASFWSISGGTARTMESS
jgi:hypothetical protein